MITEIDLPDVVAEVKEAFAAYEKALTTNDVVALDALFHKDSRTLRYGVGENLYGYEAIAAFRAARNPAGLMRDLVQTVITAYGRDTAVASTLFYRASAPSKVGRQMQIWMRFAEGWRIVAAHVSLIDTPNEKS
ncbi:MAG: oxalurate catabolism protein HpxZ [Afipia sp.]